MPETRVAIVADGEVLTVSTWDKAKAPDWRPPEPWRAVELPDVSPVTAGWLWSGKKFSPPPKKQADEQKA